MSSRPPVTFDQNGQELVGYGAPNLPFVNMPSDVAWGGVLTGWLEHWRNNSRNQALTDFARMCQTLVTIQNYKRQLAILTNEENIRNDVKAAGEEIRTRLEELERTSRKRRELEEIEIDKRAISRALVKEERELVMRDIADRKRPQEERLSEAIQTCRRLLADLEANDDFNSEGKDIMRRQLEAIRDKKLFEITGVAVARAPSPTPSSNSSSAPNKTEAVKRRQARCEAAIASIKSNSDMEDSEKRAHVRALRAECEDDCRSIMEG